MCIPVVQEPRSQMNPMGNVNGTAISKPLAVAGGVGRMTIKVKGISGQEYGATGHGREAKRDSSLREPFLPSGQAGAQKACAGKSRVAAFGMTGVGGAALCRT